MANIIRYIGIYLMFAAILAFLISIPGRFGVDIFGSFEAATLVSIIVFPVTVVKYAIEFIISSPEAPSSLTENLASSIIIFVVGYWFYKRGGES